MNARSFFIVLPALCAAAACQSFTYVGRASDEWTRRYEVAPGTIIEIVDTNGEIAIEAGDGNDVDVRAERVVRAATDASARDILSHVTIAEDVGPDRLSLRTVLPGGAAASVDVHYRIRAPRTVMLRAWTTNGAITISGLSGDVEVKTTNGPVQAIALSGAIDARTTNGTLDVGLAALSGRRVSLRATNGPLELRLPKDGGADVSASTTNGSIHLTGNMAVSTREASRGRVAARINGGPVEIETTNGGIRIRAGA